MKFKQTYYLIQNFLLNGIYSYALFGLYALTISPLVTRLFDYNQKNYFIAIFGFFIWVAEFFALYFKLKMIRIRAELKRIAYKKETGIDLKPSTGAFVFLQFFFRLLFRAAIIMVCMTALGFNCNEKKMDVMAELVLLICFALDMFGFFFIYANTNFNYDKNNNTEEQLENETWNNKNLGYSESEKYFRLEVFSDLILQIYAIMLFTAFWKYINEYAIEMISKSLNNHKDSDVGLTVFFMLFAELMIGLMPIRIAYWIEDSLNSYSKQDKNLMRLNFIIVGFFACLPTITKYVGVAFIKKDIQLSSVGGYIGSVVCFISLFLLQYLFRGKRNNQKA
jgi:hypothetical protein